MLGQTNVSGSRVLLLDTTTEGRSTTLRAERSMSPKVATSTRSFAGSVPGRDESMLSVDASIGTPPAPPPNRRVKLAIEWASPWRHPQSNFLGRSTTHVARRAL